MAAIDTNKLSTYLGIANEVGKTIKGVQASRELQRNVDGLADQRDEIDLAGTYRRLAQEFPDLFGGIAPALASTSIGLSGDLTSSNARNFNSARDIIDPNAAGIQARRGSLLQSLDPANLGQEELLGITRQLSPLIPVGTLDPNTGAVQGATTSPVSLYRNLISSNYAQRRSEYLSQASQFNIESISAAERQSERAAPFLSQALDFAVNSSANVASADTSARLKNIEGQEKSGGGLGNILATVAGLGLTIATGGAAAPLVAGGLAAANALK